MIARLLLWLAILVGIVLAFRNLVRALVGSPASPLGGRRPHRSQAPPSRDTMVLDRVCKTYIPKTQAIAHRDGRGPELYFCSDECRRKHLSAVNRRSDIA